MMKILFATATLLLASSGLSQAAFDPAADTRSPIVVSDTASDAGALIKEAKQGRGGGDNSGSGRGNSGSGSGNSDDDSNDDNGGINSGGGSNTAPSGSGRRKPRIPGGSGCDDPGDVAEHAECRG